MKIILISGKAESGKDSLANILKDEMEQKGKTVLITHYADLLKYICKTFFNWNGEKDAVGRALLQKVGAENIRKAYPDFWVKFIFELLIVFNKEWDYVLIPDCRFKNEIEYFDDGWYDWFKVKTIRVNRLEYKSTLTEDQQRHASETDLDDYDFDYTINSKSGLEI